MHKKVPTSLLLLSRALYLPEDIPAPDALKATLSKLPENIVSLCNMELCLHMQQ